MQGGARLRLLAQQIVVGDAIEMFLFEVVDLIGLRERDVDAVRARDVVVEREGDVGIRGRGSGGQLTEKRAVVAFDALLAPVGGIDDEDERCAATVCDGRADEGRRVFGQSAATSRPKAPMQAARNSSPSVGRVPRSTRTTLKRRPASRLALTATCASVTRGRSSGAATSAAKVASKWLLPTPRSPASARAVPRPAGRSAKASSQRASRSEVASVKR